MTASVEPTAVERLVRRDRLIVTLALALITFLSWIYLIGMPAHMDMAAPDEAEMHRAMGMVGATPWSLAEVGSLFLMWAAMMAGMMLPSAAPFILLATGAYRRRRGRRARVCAGLFAAGYLAAWTGFSALAAGLQAALHAAAVMSSAMSAQSVSLAGGIFVVAGLYQWTPLKSACLSHCRSPLAFLTAEWREGVWGAFVMGLRHGLFCVGCCWALMALLFAAGVMNLLWVAAIAVFVLLEKLLPRGLQIGRASGVLLVAWGVFLVVQGK